MENNNEVLLKVEHLGQHFGMGKGVLKAVDDVSFDIKKGEVFGLVGESGCGKTTTGRSIIKLYNITSGDVYFKGQRICAGNKDREESIVEAKAKAKEEIRKFKCLMKKEVAKKDFYKDEIERVKQELADFIAKVKTEMIEVKDELKKVNQASLMTKIQMVFQDPMASLNPRMTVREIISEGLQIQGIKDKEYIDRKVYEVLELVGLVPEHAGRYPHEFSGGQRQRIGIARAIIMEPELIIADEPISALDVSIQAQVINLLNELRDKMGLTILFIAHDLSVVKYFSDRIGVMHFGKMVELAPADELFAHPLHPYTKSLLSAIPLPDPHYEKMRKRIVYNPSVEHDYSQEGPSMREISEGHFVYCNTEEMKRYKKEMLEQ